MNVEVAHSARTGQALRLDAITGRYDPVLAVIAIAIAGIGVVMVGSSSIAVAEGQGLGPFYFLIRHVVFLLGGVGLAFALMRTELRMLEQRSHLLLALCFVLLAAVFVPGAGRTINGAKRWLNLGFSNFQAVEAVKPMLIVWLSSYLVRYREEIARGWWPILKPVGVALALVAMLLMQPDFGSASLILAVTGGMLLLGGASLIRLLGPVVVGLPVFAMVAMSQAYRVRRLTSFLDPWADPFKDGFQLTQALIAVGRGEWFGVGLGGSVQKLFYLPEAHTDFILAVIGGMLLLGGASLIRLFGPVVVGLPVFAMVAMSQAYRVRRLTSFLDPWADPFKDGFQLTQALIAVGRGEWFGVGLGGSVQKLFYLPEAHTDFILAVIAEEFGFAGILVVVALYAAFTARCFQIGLRAASLGRYFAANCSFGIALWMSLQALVSIGVNLGLLPTKGLTLPLISSGGSSVLMSVAAVGLMLRISYEVDRAQRQVARARADAVPLEPIASQHALGAADTMSANRPAAATSRSAARHISPRDRIEPRIGEVA